LVYQKDIFVRVPVSATSLSPDPTPLLKTKVSFDAVTDLLDLARQLEISSQEGIS
jgi:hypothetical protein